MPAGERSQRIVAKRAARAGALVGTGVLAAVGLAATSPTVRAEAHRLRSFLRPLDPSGGVPMPPPLPPGRVVVVAGRGELFVRDSGAPGPAVLLLHGWSATADVNFFTAYPALGAYRVVAPDHRSHGRGLRSDAPFSIDDCADDAAALLGTLGIDRAVAVGYSMGGSVALALARHHPDKVAGLVLAATALEFSGETRDQALWHGLSLVEGALRHGRGDGLVQRLLREAVDRQPELDRYRAWLAGELRRVTRPGSSTPGGPCATSTPDPTPPGSSDPPRWSSPPTTAWSCRASSAPSRRRSVPRSSSSTATTTRRSPTAMPSARRSALPSTTSCSGAR